MDEIIVSAPGKIILHGEHAVVYGKPALASSLSLRSYLHLTNRHDDKISLNLPNIDVHKSWTVELLTEYRNQITDSFGTLEKLDQPTDDILAKIKQIAQVDGGTNDSTQLAMVVFVYLYLILGIKSKTLPAIDLYVKSSLPVGAGLGSSAGYSVCLVSSLLLLYGRISEADYTTGQWSLADLQLINKWAFTGEKIIHGKPSGVDNSVATFGGMLKYQNGKIDVLKKTPELKILLVNTKIPRSTKTLVESVRKKYDKYPDIIKPVLDSMEAITHKCQEEYDKLVENPSSSTDIYQTLEDLIDINQSHLTVLGVSHPALDSICRVCREKNLHAKLTGAGGGGCAMCLIHPDTSSDTIKDLKIELQNMKFDCLETTIGGTGLTRHFQLPAKFIEPDSIT